jgi:hypothetical protein
MSVEVSLKNLRGLLSDAELVVTSCCEMLLEVAITLERQVEQVAALSEAVRDGNKSPMRIRPELDELRETLARIVERLKALDGGDG